MSDGGVIRLAGRREVVLGRDVGCDLVLDDAAVEPRHVAIENRAGRYVLVPVRTSTVHVNGRPVADPTVLYGDDRIRIGPFTLVYERGIVAVTRQLRAPGTAPRVPNVPDRITIGRAPWSDVPLAEPSAGWNHAVVERERDGWYVRNVEGATETTLNDAPLEGRTRLAEADALRIGPAVLTWNGATFTRLDAPAGFGIVATDLRRTVGEGRVILDGVSLEIEPNELIAIVGGSGTGKSTLLTALAGFQPAEGTVLVGGADLYVEFEAFRSLIGYVPQQDIVHRPLTAAAALRYVAELRLPAETAVDREARIAAVLELVGLEERANTRIDALSGGQVKRVSTAVELLAEPRVLFLDEPTSGLDPSLDRRLMDTFRDLADDGRTVVLVTHATGNIRVCDKVAFMAPGGRLAFFGSPDALLDEFGVDEFADVYPLVEQGAAPAAGRRPSPPPADGGRPDSRATPRPPAGPAGARRPDLRRQFGTLVRRYAEIVIRDRRNTLLLLAQAPAIGLLVALAAEPSVFETGTLAQRQTVAFVLAIVATWFGAINACREITKELPIVRRERMAGLTIAPYVASKVVVLSALIAAQTILLLPIVLLRTGVPTEAAVGLPVIALGVTFFLTGLAATGMGLLLSAVASTEDRAISLVPIVLIPQLVLAGVIFNLDGALGVLSRLTVARWATEAFGSIVDVCAGPCPTGLVAYEPTAGHVTTRWLVLAFVAIALIALAGWVVRRRDPLRR